MTGIRSCTGATSALASVVRSANVRSGGPSRGSHSSHSPAIANGSLDFARNRERHGLWSVAPPLVEAVRGHEGAPPPEGLAEAGLRRGRLGARVDRPARVRGIRGPCGHESPSHRLENGALRFPRGRMTGSSCPGAAFQRGRRGTASPRTRNREIRASAGDVIQYRPHMGRILRRLSPPPRPAA